MKDGPLEIRGVTICYVQMNKIPRWNAENTTKLLEQSSEGNTFNSALLQKSLEALSFISHPLPASASLPLVRYSVQKDIVVCTQYFV